MLHTKTLACLIATFIALAPSTRSANAESVTLQWRLQEAARFSVVSTIEQHTNTTLAGQMQQESISQRTTRIVTVGKTERDGTMNLLVELDTLTIRKESDTMTMTVSASRDDTGDLNVDAVVNTKVASFDAEEFESYFEAVVTNLFEVGFDLRVTQQGRVLSSKANGDPFAKLPEVTEATALASQVIRQLLSPEDLAQAVAAELFVQLPDQPVEIGDHWPVARSVGVSGIQMAGNGRSTLLGVDNAAGVSVADLSEQLEYTVLTDGFETRLESLMTRIYESMGVKVKISIDLKAKPVRAESSARFDITAGHCSEVRWVDMSMPLTGKMTVGKQSSDMEMLVEMSNGKSTWTRLAAK